MNRRDFLKGLAVAIGSATIPKIEFLESGEPFTYQPDNPPKNRGLIREVFDYDIVSCLYITRYDIKTRDNQQYHVWAVTQSSGPTDDVRRRAIELLSKEMRHRNIGMSDLVVMELPPARFARYVG